MMKTDEQRRKERGKRGLVGNSGFVAPGLHIAANYGAANDECFVAIEQDGMPSWERTTGADARARGLNPILCVWPGCRKFARRMDHYYPYYVDACRCDEHADFKKFPMGDI